MSKKSRRRNRKILGALAAGLGAMALMRGRKANQMSGMETVSDAQKVTSQLGAGDVTGTDYPGANKVVVADTKPVDTSSNFQTRFKAKDSDGVWKGPGQIMNERRLTAGNKVPPSMRGGAETAQGFVRKVPTGVRTRMGNTNYGWSTTPYKSGGRVRGAGKAKRGFGRALKKGRK